MFDSDSAQKWNHFDSRIGIEHWNRNRASLPHMLIGDKRAFLKIHENLNHPN